MDMATSDNAQLTAAQNSARTEQRISTLLISVVMAIGAWWLQNQFNTTERISQQVLENSKHVALHYPDREEMKLHVSDLSRQLERVQREIENIHKKIDVRHPPGRTPLGSGWKQYVPPDAGLDP